MVLNFCYLKAENKKFAYCKVRKKQPRRHGLVLRSKSVNYINSLKSLQIWKTKKIKAYNKTAKKLMDMLLIQNNFCRSLRTKESNQLLEKAMQ